AVDEFDQAAPGGLAGPAKLGPKPVHGGHYPGFGIGDCESRVPNPESRSGTPEIAAARTAAGRSGAERAARIAGAVAAAGRAARVAARFVRAAGDRFLGLVDHLAATLRPGARRFRRLLVLLRCGVAQVFRLLADRAAQVRTRLRREQHAEA